MRMHAHELALSSVHMLWCRPWLVGHTALARWALQRSAQGWVNSDRPWAFAVTGNSMLQFYRGASRPAPIWMWRQLGWCQPARPTPVVRRRLARWRALRAEAGRARRMRAQALAAPGWRDEMRELQEALSAEAEGPLGAAMAAAAAEARA